MPRRTNAQIKAQHDLIQKKLADAEKATLAAQVDAAMARAQLETAKPTYLRRQRAKRHSGGGGDQRDNELRRPSEERMVHCVAF